jgi:hypothetical protein
VLRRPMETAACIGSYRHHKEEWGQSSRDARLDVQHNIPVGIDLLLIITKLPLPHRPPQRDAKVIVIENKSRFEMEILKFTPNGNCGLSQDYASRQQPYSQSPRVDLRNAPHGG